MQPDQSLAPLDSLLARLLAAWPNSRLPPASYALYREKLANVPTNTLSSVIEHFIEKGGKYAPHVGEILGQCKGAMEPAAAGQDVWTWAGMTLADFEKLPGRSKRLWGKRWTAHVEARRRHHGMNVQSSNLAEPLDDVLFQLGMDSRGGLIDTNPLGSPQYHEEPEIVDNRDWRSIANDSGERLRSKMDVTIAAGKKARAAQTVPADDDGELF